MDIQKIDARDVYGAREKILDCIRRRGDKRVMYFVGFNEGGLGAAPVLRSIAQELRSIQEKKTPAELCFHRILYIDCSSWESRRVMERKIAEEIQLDLETMAILDKQDEEDDFSGKDHGSRDLVRSVSAAIDQAVGNRNIMMIFINGSDDAVDVSRSGINPDYRDHTILWTFKRRPVPFYYHAPQREGKQRYTEIYFCMYDDSGVLPSSRQFALLREEAVNMVAPHPWMMPCIDIRMATECCLYELFLQYDFHRATGFDWAAHAPNYWMCDGIIKGSRTREIGSTLYQKIHWEMDDARMMFDHLMKDPEAPFFVVKGEPLLIKRPYPWISVTSNDLIIHKDTDKALLERVSSLFVALGQPDYLQGLPDGFLEHCSNLRVLILCRCAFSFVSPPFLRCHKLRFLGLDHCRHDNTTSEGENNNTDWAWLQNLWVLDLRYTSWHDILSEGKTHNMTNLMELNIEAFMELNIEGLLHGKLPSLLRLRIIKPRPRYHNYSFMLHQHLGIITWQIHQLTASTAAYLWTRQSWRY